MIKLVVALGNPGREYEDTRHNIAWLVLDKFQAISSANWKSKFKGEYTDISIKGEKVYFLKPSTYMNLSGESVQPLCKFFKIKPEEILVIHDELDLPFGQVVFKKGGGLAGHNGLKSITQHMGTQNFLRLRVGIDRPVHGSVSSWVLSKFDDQIGLDLLLDKMSNVLQDTIELGFEKASGKYSKKNLISE
jgi:PTH1 family peptidyl-tRNA hydrolase